MLRQDQDFSRAAKQAERTTIIRVGRRGVISEWGQKGLVRLQGPWMSQEKLPGKIAPNHESDFERVYEDAFM